jgi:prevent-host-death family protein
MVSRFENSVTFRRCLSYDEAEAQERFSELIDRVLDGEVIIITRLRVPVAELKPVQHPPPGFV